MHMEYGEGDPEIWKKKYKKKRSQVEKKRGERDRKRATSKTYE